MSASVDNDGRKKFDTWLRERCNSEPDLIKMKIPEAGLVHDYIIDDGGIFDESEEDEEEETKVKPIQWRNWMQNLPDLVISNDTKFSDIIG